MGNYQPLFLFMAGIKPAIDVGFSVNSEALVKHCFGEIMLAQHLAWLLWMQH